MRWQSPVINTFCLMLLLLLSASPGCTRSSENQADPDAASENEKLIIAASVPPHAWLIEQCTTGIRNVEIITVVPSGASPENYQPTDAQVSRISKARVFFAAGVPFENGAWADALKSMKSLRTVDLRDGIELRDMESHSHGTDDEQNGHADDAEHDHNDELLGKDPHTWLAPSTLSRQTATITNTLAELDPANAAHYLQRALDIKYDLLKLDEELVELLRPYRGRSFFVFHPAWGYFADAYGLKQIAIEIEGKNPTDRELTELQRMATESGTKTIFVQPQITGFAAQAVASAIGGTVKRIDPLEPNIPENLRAVAQAFVASFNNTGG